VTAFVAASKRPPRKPTTRAATRRRGTRGGTFEVRAQLRPGASPAPRAGSSDLGAIPPAAPEARRGGGQGECREGRCGAAPSRPARARGCRPPAREAPAPPPAPLRTPPAPSPGPRPHQRHPPRARDAAGGGKEWLQRAVAPKGSGSKDSPGSRAAARAGTARAARRPPQPRPPPPSPPAPPPRGSDTANKNSKNGRGARGTGRRRAAERARGRAGADFGARGEALDEGGELRGARGTLKEELHQPCARTRTRVQRTRTRVQHTRRVLRTLYASLPHTTRARGGARGGRAGGRGRRGRCCQQRECTVGTWVGATVGRGGGGHAARWARRASMAARRLV
jgi:hypothetical protein